MDKDFFRRNVKVFADLNGKLVLARKVVKAKDKKSTLFSLATDEVAEGEDEDAETADAE